ncbi:NTPase KAP family P-loop domain-containing protein 1 [Hippoglossus hippoglossus]|uniref:NTPase KAP family P-loop domain-containing protein 1 n=1 Tax=Hippoglossus hippoglossus TaxID=8267 RepID=UPI00148CA37D|nr:NTPase KAP family P-loop domain-containing protein 1 [Hippoglossus hippoglossus]XP_034432560.1 NTPase KAP family P-loop domain-containing protein 1 [Hippoglossus hippoglossus]XP_034432567.1 NTPase KAP family P-loop domain-containing protein 1 [Hippoglossus hippoglossus]XP_034432575.1 NTPase KAP family P-loop domain-containing protein 1 [Hippoglossus hippoglossus]
MYNPPRDDSYAYALSKTLTKVSSPATVGLYSSCQNRVNMILGQMEVFMDEEAVKIENEHKGKPRSSFTGFFGLIGRLLFYRPVWTKTNQQLHDIRFIYVHFSAWHFAGSDLLWAGLAIRLFQAMQINFGKLQLALYRVAQHDEEEEFKKKIVENGTNNWRSKKICCCPLWCLVLVILVVPVIILVFLLTFGIPKPAVKPDGGANKGNGQVGMLEGLIIASLGVPAASAVRFTFLMVKNLIVNQEVNINKGMDNKRVSSQLGFMNEVRKEMWFLCRFIRFMELFERRRIRVVLKITNLDRCAPKKIVAVLEAINILLSDEESPFISILAVDPDVLVQKVNFADDCFSEEDRAHALLNRIVTLAFTIPPLCDDSKKSLYYSLTGNSKFSEDMSVGKDNQRTGDPNNKSSSDVTEVLIPLEQSNSPTDTTTEAFDVNEEEVETLVRSIMTSNKRNINQYMSDDAMSMRRVINSIRVTAIMIALNKHLPQPENVAAWVVLANQWPCRLSWIIQCAEDAEQRAAIDCKSVDNTDDSKTLWEVFRESKAELYVMSAQIEDLLEQDGDPEMFERFLTVDFQFTVKDLKTFEVVTVNLDHTIRKELAQMRGTSRLKDSGWMRDLAPLPITTIINMDTEGVCKELERMKYPSKYIDKVESNDLNGMALLFGNTDDLKDLLDMTYGEWATFRLHFLGLPSHLRPQNKNLLPAPSHPQNQLLRFKAHKHHHYSSNASLVSSSM